MTGISYATPLDTKNLPFKDRRVRLRVAGVALILLGSVSGCFSILTPVGMLMSVLVQPGTGAARGPMVAPAPMRTAPATGPAAAPATAPASEAPSAAGTAAPATAPTTGPATVVTTATTTTRSVSVTAWAPGSGVDYRTMAFALAMYVLATVLFIWTGVGALRLSRWVRPVMLIVGWTWLLSGVIGTLYWLVGTPSLRQMIDAATPPGTPRPPPAAYTVMAWSAGTMMTLVMVFLPAALLWAFGRKGVRETLEYFDPRVRWTDACPTPALAVSAWLAAAAVGCLLYCAYAVLPLYGLVVSGAAAVAGLLLLAAAFAALTWLTYRLRPSGWWGALVVHTLWAGSMVWTFSHVGWHEFYVKAGYSPEQVDALMRYSGSYADGSMWMVALWSVLFVGYLLYVRRFFVHPRGGAGSSASGAS